MLAQPSLLAWLALICVMAGIAKGLTGFGAALIMAPLFSLLISPSQTAVLVVLLHALTGLQGAREWWSAVRWRIVIALVAIALAVHQMTLPLLAMVDETVVRRVTGALVLLLGLSSLCGLQVRHAGGVVAMFVASAASGIFTAFGGLGGPPVAYFFAGQPGTDVRMRANLLAYFMLLFSGAALQLAVHGDVGVASLTQALLLAPFFFIGMMAGSKLFTRLPSNTYKRTIQWGMTLIGAFALLH